MSKRTGVGQYWNALFSTYAVDADLKAINQIATAERSVVFCCCNVVLDNYNFILFFAKIGFLLSLSNGFFLDLYLVFSYHMLEPFVYFEF